MQTRVRKMLEPIDQAQRLLNMDARHNTVQPETVLADKRADFGLFYAQHRDRLAQALTLTLGDADLGASAADEAMTRCLKKWKQVSGYANPQGFAYRVGLNWARSFLRRRKRERDRPIIWATDHPPAGYEPAITQALSQLSLDHRAVIVCRYFLDYSTEQTAQALDVPTGTVKSRLARAIDNLRPQLRHLEQQ